MEFGRVGGSHWEVQEQWEIGVMEYWSNGMMESVNCEPNNFLHSLVHLCSYWRSLNSYYWLK